MATFTARYHGECTSCGQGVKGYEVAYDSDGGLVHVDCTDAPPERTRPICPVCNTEKPCFCD